MKMTNNSPEGPEEEKILRGKNDSRSSSFKKIEKEGLFFIDSQKRFLVWSALLPIFIILIQIANIVFVSMNPPPPGRPPLHREAPRIIEVLSPGIIMIIIALFVLANFFFLLHWQKKVQQYNDQEETFDKLIKSSPDEIESGTEFISLSQITYDIIQHVKKIRIIFFLMNAVAVFYFFWFVSRIVFRLAIGRLVFRGPPAQFPLILIILNILAQIGLLIYLVFQWKFFLKWDLKFSKLDMLEKRIFEELDL
ncbi:hypothetical protein [Candidatus Borrarchaeum sp.]|uniref:hypothetical protein n=1 Tax=Candidatus Borrarchaeum sp. TaxID=2846742 RepID=UPI0025796B65|nr:hypothetical protein [Candidatus Borrarchaeum sp.]